MLESDLRVIGLHKILREISEEYSYEEFIRGIFGALAGILMTGKCTENEVSSFMAYFAGQYIDKFNETRPEPKG